MHYDNEDRAASHKSRTRRVVVTGLGVVTSIGIGRELFWKRLMSGYSGIASVHSFDTSQFSVHKGAEVKDFRPTEHLFTLSPDDIDRASQFAVAAARLAVQDASLSIEESTPDDIGVVVGTTSGEPRVIERFDDHFVTGNLEMISPKFISTYPSHLLAAHVACELKLGGEVVTIPTACAAGNHAIARAFDEVCSGKTQIMLAGGRFVLPDNLYRICPAWGHCTRTVPTLRP